MTGETLGPLGRRFLAAFVAVTLTAVALVTVAGLVGSQRGLTSQSEASRQAVADRVAAAVAQEYGSAAGWERADLSQANAVARGGGAVMVVLASDGTVVWREGGRGPHGGMGMGMAMSTSRTVADVVVDGLAVGQVVLRFGPPSGAAGRPVAWSWILVAAVGALTLAVLAAWFVSRQLTRPVAALTQVARSFAAGDRDALVHERGTGELAELADAFEDAVVTVRRAEESRSRMAADVAHELRTPLAALQAGLEELRDGLAPADPEALARLHDQAQRVSQIVGDLDTLFAAEGATRVLRRERVDLSELAREEVASRAAQLRAADLDVALAVPEDRAVLALGDLERMHQVVGNLLENCVRHCRPGDSVRVLVGDTDGGSAVRLTVSDTGPGIPAGDLPQVFDRFWRGPRQTGRPGSGLGLAVVRSLVEAQGGTVKAESDGATGSTFTVELPGAADRLAG
jgi:two-component system, OmpR family, sensor histidine kinase BaeS